MTAPESSQPAKRRQTIIRWSITGIAVAALLVKHLMPDIKIDAVTLGLLALMLLPWAADVVKSVEIPGVGKIELQEVQSAGDKVLASGPQGVVPAPPDVASGTPAIIDTPDPVTSLVNLRIEIHKALYRLAKEDGEPMPMRFNSVGLLLRQALQRGRIDQEMYDGLAVIVESGNRAAHGVSVDPAVANWVQTDGRAIIDKLHTLR